MTGRFRRSQGRGYEELYLLGYNPVLSVKYQPTFQKNTSPAILSACFHVDVLFGLFFDYEDGGDMFLRNIGWHSTDYTALYPERHQCNSS
jgi:hypothetical protein